MINQTVAFWYNSKKTQAWGGCSLKKLRNFLFIMG